MTRPCFAILVYYGMGYVIDYVSIVIFCSPHPCWQNSDFVWEIILYVAVFIGINSWLVWIKIGALIPFIVNWFIHEPIPDPFLASGSLVKVCFEEFFFYYKKSYVVGDGSFLSLSLVVWGYNVHSCISHLVTMMGRAQV